MSYYGYRIHGMYRVFYTSVLSQESYHKLLQQKDHAVPGHRKQPRPTKVFPLWSRLVTCFILLS